MKKLIFVFSGLVLALSSFSFVSAYEEADVEFFYSPTCPHCAKEKIFLKGLEEKYPALVINQYDVINSQENRKLLNEFYEKYNVPKSLQGLVPATFVSAKYFVGFDDEVAKEIEGLLENRTAAAKDSIALPLPAMAIVSGALDGFNVCSLGALILILSLVLALNSRKKIFIFGGIYLLTTAIVYGFLIFFWYKLFEAVAPYLKIMNILIGVLGISGGIYFFRQFLKSRKSSLACDSESAGKISSKLLPKLQKLLNSPSSLLLAAGAVFVFAFMLTVVEFPCSAVVPIAFAAVLSQAGYPPVLYILYIAIYILFYLLDEIIIFLVALITSKLWMSSPKFFKWIVLLEAIILFAIGFYYLSPSL